MSHVCHAAGCTRKVPPRMFSCREHWFALPKKVRDAVWREYQPGQESTKRVTASYLAVQRYAVAFLARRDGLAREMEAAVFDAVMHEAVCRDKYKSEPLAGLDRFWEAT